jgi:hypothetical protein
VLSEMARTVASWASYARQLTLDPVRHVSARQEWFRVGALQHRQRGELCPRSVKVPAANGDPDRGGCYASGPLAWTCQDVRIPLASLS